MAQDKRETVRLTRIKTRPSYISNDMEERYVYGYLNSYNEFRLYDYEWAPGFQSFSEEEHIYIINKSPRAFFQAAMPYDEYKKLSFVISGVHERFDRRIHSLDDYRSRIYLQQPFGDVQKFDSKDKTLYKYKKSLSKPLDFLNFRINPRNLKLDKQKLFKKLRTRAGWAFQHWGPEIGKISISGTTGNLTPDPSIILGVKNMPIIGGTAAILPYASEEKPTELNSPAYKAFKDLEKWYDQDQDERSAQEGYLTAFEYRDRVYIGHFADFHLEEKGTDPYQLFYTMTFLVHYDTNNLQNATTRARSQIIRNHKTLDTVLSLKGSNG